VVAVGVVAVLEPVEVDQRVERFDLFAQAGDLGA